MRLFKYSGGQRSPVHLWNQYEDTDKVKSLQTHTSRITETDPSTERTSPTPPIVKEVTDILLVLTKIR